MYTQLYVVCSYCYLDDLIYSFPLFIYFFIKSLFVIVGTQAMWRSVFGLQHFVMDVSIHIYKKREYPDIPEWLHVN